jgi:hypothetical protein
VSTIEPIDYEADARQLAIWLHTGLPSGTVDALAELIGMDHMDLYCKLAKIYRDGLAEDE